LKKATMKFDVKHVLRIAWWLFSHIFADLGGFLLIRYQKYGVLNYVYRGPLLVCSNHVSWFDPPIVGAAQFRVMHYIANRKLFRFPFFAAFISMYGAFPLDLEKPAAGMKTTFKILAGRKEVLIFPEGTRSVDGKLRPGELGVGMLIYKAKARVIPAYVAGSHFILPEGESLWNAPIKVFIGREFPADEYRRMPADKETYRLVADRITEALAGLRDFARENRV
jgi:1-acyl-sn-glycerol-3-phosphate acyltransferase